MNLPPKVSIVMPVYNGELYVREAIDSMLNQTFSDFELIAIDDCSTDRSIEVIQSYTDPRIRLIANPFNQGVRFIANQGNKLARAEYIARMDCDDISLPDRLAKQVEFLDRHPEIAVVGGSSLFIDPQGSPIKSQNMLRFALEPSSIRWTASYECPFENSAVMYRKQILAEALGGYNENTIFAEDYDIWLRLLKNNYQGANLNEVLLKYRVHPTSMMHSANADIRISAVTKMRIDYFDDLIPGYDREKALINDFFNTRDPQLVPETIQALDILRDRYISIHLNGRITKDLSISMAREHAYLAYCLFSVDRWQATRLMFKSIWQYPGLLGELPLLKVIYLVLFGRRSAGKSKRFYSR